MTARQLLSGSVEIPEFADQLIDTITRRSGTAEEWVEGSNEEEDSARGESRGYGFASEFAQGGGAEAPTRERAGSVARVKGMVGMGGRSRSSSSVKAPAVGGGRFEQDFGDSYGEDLRESVRSEGRRESAGSSKGARAEKAKLTKARSGSGGAGGLRGMAEGMSWGASSRGPERESSSRARESFDSLDDERNSYGNVGSTYGNVGSDDEGPRRTTPQRFPGTSRTSSTYSSTASPFADSARPNLSSSQKSYSTKPWDSEDEDLMSFNPNRPVLSTKPSSTTRRDPFDLSELNVELDRPLARKAAPQPPLPSVMQQRRRTLTAGKGIGSAIALFDFNGVEVRLFTFECAERTLMWA